MFASGAQKGWAGQVAQQITDAVEDLNIVRGSSAAYACFRSG